jgi:hypothetical protein
MIESSDELRQNYASGQRLTVALPVGTGIMPGVIRIIKGWPFQWFILSGSIAVVIMTVFAPPGCLYPRNRRTRVKHDTHLVVARDCIAIAGSRL